MNLEPVMNLYDDKSLFLLVAEGDEAAFELLFNAWLPQLHPQVFKIVQSEAAVKDIIQEVFLALWLGRDKLPAVEEPGNWIFRIAYNQSLRYLKKQTLKDRVLVTFQKEQPPAHSLDTEQVVNATEINRLVQQAIQELPPQSRNIFQLSRTAGMKPAEIAIELNISIQAVRNSLTRSGKSIRAFLDQHGIHIPVLLLCYLIC